MSAKPSFKSEYLLQNNYIIYQPDNSPWGSVSCWGLLSGA